MPPTQWNDGRNSGDFLGEGNEQKLASQLNGRELGRTVETQTESDAGDGQLRSQVLCGRDLSGGCLHSLGRRFGHSLSSPNFCQKARTTGVKGQEQGGR